MHIVIFTLFMPQRNFGTIHPCRCISPIFFEAGILNLVWMYLGMAECSIPSLGHCDFDFVPYLGHCDLDF